jgi:type IX secretion system PorP/SprF family membrane protein
MKGLLLLVFLFTGVELVRAQDIHLTQFYTQDHLLNPAKVGDYKGDYRISGNYRNQWRQIAEPINTFLVSMDKVFHYYSYDFHGGLMVARDGFAGFNQVATKIFITGSIGKEFFGNDIRVGVQTGWVSKSTDLTKQTFPSQWDYPTGTFNTSMSTQESSINDSQNFIDFNTGVQWTKNFSKFQAKVGLGLNHINRPKDTYFTSAVERLRVRKVTHAEVDYYLNSKVTLQPKLFFMWTTQSNDLLFGGNVKYALSNKFIPYIYGGMYYRHGISRNVDAVSPVAGLSYKGFDFGLSYDVNVSAISEQVKRVGTFEVSVIYTAPSSKTKFKILPCDRY